MTKQDLDCWCQSLARDEVTLDTADGELKVFTGGLIHRPPVYGSGRGSSDSDAPMSLSRDLGVIESYWQVNKLDVFASCSRPQIKEVLSVLQDDTGIKFCGLEVGRVGNFEIQEYPVGDYQIPSGLCCEVSTGASYAALEICLQPPLAGEGEMLVGCRLFNGGLWPASTKVLDLVKCWPPADGNGHVRFEAKEPFYEFEVSVWRVSDGELIAHLRQSLIRSASIGLSVSVGMKEIDSPWVRRHPQHLQPRARQVPQMIEQNTAVRGERLDPWVEAEQEAGRLITLHPRSEESHFLRDGNESQLETIEFLRGKICAEGVSGVVITDPYFDETGVDMVLARRSRPTPVSVVTSLVGGDARRSVLPGFCESNRALLSNVRIVSVENATLNDLQQFHDRYLILTMGGNQHEVWALSNSLSSAAKRFPLVITRLSPETGESVVEYFDKLQNSTWPGRENCVSSVLWDSASSQTAGMSPGYQCFPGEDVIGHVLPPGSSVSDTLGAFEQPELASKLAQMATDRLRNGGGSLEDLFSPVAYWAYHGGPQARDYVLSQEELERASIILRSWVEQHPQVAHQKNPQFFDSGLGFADYFLDSLQLIDNVENAYGREGVPAWFWATVLWLQAPDKLVLMIRETQSWLLVQLLADTSNHEGVVISQADTLLKSGVNSLRALGAALLYRTAGEDRCAACSWGKKLLTAGIVETDVFTAMLTIFLEDNRVDLPSLAAFWPGSISAADVARVVQMVKQARGSAAVFVLEQLAAALHSEQGTRMLLAETVRDFCQRLPLKASGISHYRGQESRIPLDISTDIVETIVRLILNLNPNDASEWYLREAFDCLQFGEIHEPLLRTKDYFRWSKSVHGLLYGIYLGICLACSSSEVSAKTNRVMEVCIKVLRGMGPEVWHNSQDTSVHVRVLSILSKWFSDSRASDLFKNAFGDMSQDKTLPAHWRLHLLLGSGALLTAHLSEILVLLRDPSTFRGRFVSRKSEIRALQDIVAKHVLAHVIGAQDIAREIGLIAAAENSR